MFSTVPDSRDMLFTWLPPNSTLRNGVITGYNLTCSIQGTGTGQISSVYPPQETYRLSGFRPGTQYTCRVVAMNSAGSGPPAEVTLVSPEDGNRLFNILTLAYLFLILSLAIARLCIMHGSYNIVCAPAYYVHALGWFYMGLGLIGE